MVAYSFQKQFADAVALGTKRQTVRAARQRHARVGEAIQLYTGMRSRSCEKLIERDPVCIRVDEIEIGISDAISAKIDSIVINGIPLKQNEIEAFARADGFKPRALGWTARDSMGKFFKKYHGFGTFRGVVIHW